MKALVRFGIAAAACLACAPAQLAAQESVATTPAPPSEGAVGPSQLRDFNLNGTVVRRADPAPEGSETPPARQQAPKTAAPRQTPPPVAEPPRETVARPTDPIADRPAPVETRQSPDASSPSALELPPPTPAAPLFGSIPVLPESGDSTADPAQLPASSDNSGSFHPLPWLLALVLLGGAAVYYFRRPRRGLAFAGGPEAVDFVAPDPSPPPAPPRAAPAPSPTQAPAPVGIVSTRLRPELELQFNPGRVRVDDGQVTLEFEAQIVNSGSGPARDVLVEAAMFNAGPTQDKEISAFFERPVAAGDRVAIIAPLKSLGFKTAVAMSREQLRQFQAGDRAVFVPLVGFNLLYRWSGGDAQTSVSFLVGRATGGEKLAPFSLDQVPRDFDRLAARELDTRLRK